MFEITAPASTSTTSTVRTHWRSCRCQLEHGARYRLRRWRGGQGAARPAAASCSGLSLDPRQASSAPGLFVEVREADVEAVSLSGRVPGCCVRRGLVSRHPRAPARPSGDTRPCGSGARARGSVLLSMPNVTHGALRLELLSGKFRYDPADCSTADISASSTRKDWTPDPAGGFRAETRLRVMRRLDQTEFDVDLASIPVDHLHQARERPRRAHLPVLRDRQTGARAAIGE